MTGRRMSRSRPGPLGGDAGYSLVEMMMAVTIAVVVAFGLYAVYNSQTRSSRVQRSYLELQTACNFAMDQIKQELLLAGYRGDETTNVKTISSADAGTVTFEFYDDKAKYNDASPSDPSYDPGVPWDGQYTAHTQVQYLRSGNDVQRKVKRWHNATSQYITEATQTIARNVAALDFTYVKNDNTRLATPVATGSLDDIRNVKLSIACDAAKADPVSGKTPRITLTASVQPRNVGLESNPRDTTPPAVPTGLVAWDPGTCGSLELRWDANTETDLLGYNVVYGFSSGSYSNRVRINRGPKAAGEKEYLTLTNLTPTRYADTTPARYYVSVQAIDKSQNFSGYATEASENPTTSTRTESEVASNGTDTTIQPLIPPAPGGFTAAATPSVHNKVDLAWTAPAVDGLVGYRLYRSTSPSFTPDDTTGTGNRIADQGLLGPGAVSFTDTGLLGCQTYYYKLTAMTCDSTLPIASRNYATASAAPTDNTPPRNPLLAARPGYKRIILSLKNPVRSGSPPVQIDRDFTYTKIWYNKAPVGSPVNYPVLVEDGTPSGRVDNGTPIPDAIPYPGAGPGIFSLPGTQVAVNFNSESSGDPSYTLPSLADDVVYYFLAVSYDICGNHTPATSESQAEGALCNDCDEPPCQGPPPDLGTVTAEGCYGAIALDWNYPYLDDTDYRDLSGFHVFRREGPDWVGGTSEVELTGSDPIWFTEFEDSTVEEGKVYSYRVEATDCYYERRATWPEPGDDTGNPPHGNFKESFRGGLAVGRVVQDPARTQVVTGNILADPQPFRHNFVTFWSQNTSYGTLIGNQLAARWENPAAYLKSYIAGDGSTTPVTLAFIDTGTPLTMSSTGSLLTLSALPFAGLDTEIPNLLLFRNADDAVSATTDMRDDRLDLELTWTNDTTGSGNCSISGTIPVPLGPFVGGTTMSQPSAGTNALAVPGQADSPTPIDSVIVPGGVAVDVFTNVLNDAPPDLAGVVLFYHVDSSRVLAAAPAPTGAFPSFTNYDAIPMQYVAGNQWRTPAGSGIPASDGASVWFFVVAVDDHGNFDREPEIGRGAFQYYQQLPDVCNNTPNPPAVAGAATSAAVTLTITPPVLNTDGSSCTDVAGYRIYRRADAGGYQLVRTQATTDNPYVFTDTLGDLASRTYAYYVQAYDTCVPAKVSVASSIFTECIGAPTCSLSLAVPVDPIYAGTSFGIDLTACSKQNGSPGDIVWVQTCTGLDADPIRLVEDGDTGTFRIDSGYYGGRTEVRTYLTGDYPVGAIELDLRVNPTDTVFFGGYGNTAGIGWDSLPCDTTHACYDSVGVIPDPCISPATPGTPGSFASSYSSCTANGGRVTLSWSASTPGPVSNYQVYACNAAVDGPACEPSAQANALSEVDAGTFSFVHEPGGKLNAAGNKWRYQVRAVNKACPTDFKYSPFASMVNDGCSPF